MTIGEWLAAPGVSTSHLPMIT
ncbi:MAG: hypothetical protein JWO98_3047, partial [Frankiales bacterium]|nr:hypothetical protein [Frankiales bacterium]